MPHKLRIEVAMHIHKDIYTNFPFFFGKEKSFIAWVGPKLKGILFSDLEYIYKEGDEIKESKIKILYGYSLLPGRGSGWVRPT